MNRASGKGQSFIERLGIELPLVLAPLGGGPGTPGLAAAVSNAGGLGSIPAGYLSASNLRAQLTALLQETSKPCAVNLFVPSEPVAPAVAADLLAVVNRLRAKVGLAALEEAPAVEPDELEAKLDVILEYQPAAVSFTFGILDATVIENLRSARILTIGTATSPAEARALVDAGIEVVCLQGAEAGGHRGGFLEGGEVIDTCDLVDEVRPLLEVPLIAAGGISNAAAVQAALRAGADAVQVGTAFLLCPEAGTTAAQRSLLRSGRRPILTDAVTGKKVRAIPNELTAALSSFRPLPYPAMHALTAELRRTAAAQAHPELTGTWAGRHAAEAAAKPANQIVRDLFTFP